MHVCVVGAGVVGITTALALARQGHDVTLIDHSDEICSGVSHANGAQLSYSYVDPFASLATLRSLPAYIFGRDPAVKINWPMSPSFLSWGLRFLRECTPRRNAANLAARADMSLASQRTMAALTPELTNERSAGKLILLSGNDAVQQARETAHKYQALGLERQVVSRDEALQIEPKLDSFAGSFSGAIYAPSDKVLDPRVYGAHLKSELLKAGADLRLGEAVRAIERNEAGIKKLVTDKGSIRCDAAVLCTGPDINSVLRPMGFRLPVYPMRGYSLTLPKRVPGPVASITSLPHKIVYADLGDFIRIAGFMDANLKPAQIQNRSQELLKQAQAIWPDIADYKGNDKPWSHCRPMTPSGVPIIKEMPIRNLFVNAGHGSLGYTFAAGSAMKIAGLIGPAPGKKDEFDEGELKDVAE